MNHPPTYVRTFSLHKVRENCHFQDQSPTPISLRNIKMAPNVPGHHLRKYSNSFDIFFSKMIYTCLSWYIFISWFRLQVSHKVDVGSFLLEPVAELMLYFFWKWTRKLLGTLLWNTSVTSLLEKNQYRFLPKKLSNISKI